MAVAKYWAAFGGQRIVLPPSTSTVASAWTATTPWHRCFLQAKEIELQLGGTTRQLLALGQIIANDPV